MLMNMKELLAVAKEHNFAIPAFNIGTGEILKGVMESCEKLQAPVILAIHPLELDFQGDSFVQSCRYLASTSKVPCCIHLDHAGESDIYRAVRDGFTSVMIDASHMPFDENVAITKKIVDFCHPLGVTVEGELGTIGSTEGDVETVGTDIIYTKPEDAKKFVELTGVDALAIAIGTAHGIYPKGFKPQLKLDLLDAIKAQVDVPLVLHGGSSNPDDEIAECARRGVNKINISSDIKKPLFQSLRKVLNEHDENFREPFLVLVEPVQEMKKVVEQKIKLFNDDDKMKYYTLSAL
ncbi:MAG: ketose-bisphosphate aldolase [Clostridia bacterium]|nr:ketose-bisphosphate aldolase [Clostridia bacterium]